MFSKHFKKNKHISETGFRYRGIESSRIEHLTDAVFAFAITLLVIASEVPKSYVELQASMYNFIGFIACSLLLLGIWSNHSNFYLNYGMQDQLTKRLNFLFLFVLLFYIYPLKYLFSHLSNLLWVNIIGEPGLKNEAFVIAYNKAIDARLNPDQWQDLMLRFGLGLLLIYIIIGAMHVNALFNKKELELNEQEVFETKYHIKNYIFLSVVCISSMLIVFITGGNGSGISGSVFMLIPILLPIFKKVHFKRLKKKFPQSFNRKADDEEWSQDKANAIMAAAAKEVEAERLKETKAVVEKQDLKSTKQVKAKSVTLPKKNKDNSNK